MVRILVIGCPGAGKTTLSIELHKRLGLPLVHLDDEYWLADWQRPLPKQWLRQLKSRLKQPNWIMDGHYQRSLALRLKYATHVIYLDYPTYLCLYRALKRGLERRFISDHSLPAGVRQALQKQQLAIPWSFIRLILFFRWAQRQQIFQHLEHAELPLFHLTSPNKLDGLIKKVTLKLGDANAT